MNRVINVTADQHITSLKITFAAVLWHGTVQIFGSCKIFHKIFLFETVHPRCRICGKRNSILEKKIKE